MQHPFIVNANANERFNKMVREADAHRLQKRVSPQKPGWDFLSELKERFPILKGQRLDESASSAV